MLTSLQKITGGGRLLFPSLTSREKCMSENTMLYALYRMGYHSRATAHGFRASASTLLNDLSYRPDVIERQLAHEEGNKVRAAYHRTQYEAERRAMMQDWGAMLDLLKAGATVADLKMLANARLSFTDALGAIQQGERLADYVGRLTGKVVSLSRRRT